MVNPTTTNLQLEVPLRGAEVGTWDTPVNSDFTIIDSAFGSVTTVALSTTSVTLATSQAQASVLQFTGALLGNVTVTVPSSLIRKFWVAENLTTNSTAFTVRLSNNSTGASICLPPGEPVDVYSDGTTMKFRNLGRVGSYLDIASTSVPLWITGCTVPPYLNCDGTSFSSATYPYLNVHLGGTTLPDAKGRFRAYLNQGSSRLTSTNSGGVNGDTLLATGGEQGHQLTEPQLPAVTPAGSVVLAPTLAGLTTVPFGSVSPLSGGASITYYGPGAGSGSNVLGGTGTFTGTQFGSNSPHNTVPPVFIGGLTLIRAM